MFCCIYAPGNLPIILHCAQQFSPLIETHADMVVFDAQGLEGLHGPPESLAASVERTVGIPVNVAIAANIDAAIHAARAFQGVTVIEAGKEAATLASLPINFLGGSADVALSLDLWGIRTCGQFAALPPIGVAARLGDEGIHLQRLASGAGFRRLQVAKEELRFDAEMDLDTRIELLESLCFVFQRLLDDLLARLARASLSTNEICVRLSLEGAPDHVTTLRLPVPMTESKDLMKMLHLELSKTPPSHPVLKVSLGVPLFQEQLLRMAMTIADFTGAEAEELRRAMGFKRAELKMRGIEERLRAGMARKGIDKETQDKIVLSITSFARYGFPESHAASFALIAYASAYLKCHYLAAFTCALLNNQPMGFYSPAVLIKDAQRHGLRVLPAHVNTSHWNCTIEDHALRLGLRCVRGLRALTGEAISAAKPFTDIDELARRTPGIRKNELEMLASVGALNGIDAQHRRDALWKAGRAGRAVGTLLETVPETQPESPLAVMSTAERLTADYFGTGLTVGRHPMHFHRDRMNELGVTPAAELVTRQNGVFVRAAGCVIVRQRPGTAKGIVFLSVEDETGIFNVIIMPDVFEANRLTIVRSPYLLVEGPLQKYDSVIHVQARRVEAIRLSAGAASSHDFK
jgi:hypothetical protein